jgi:ABC-type Fe3+ transport system substrate-binding protein
MKYRLPDNHKQEAQQADCRFLTIKDLQDAKPLDYVYPPELMIPTRAEFIQRAANLRNAKQVTKRGEE